MEFERNVFNLIHDRVLDHLVSELPDLWAVYAFGSYAQGTAHEYSDLDLACLLPNPMTRDARHSLMGGLIQMSNRAVDLVDLRWIPTDQQITILNQGFRIFCAPDADAIYGIQTFEAQVLYDYATLNEDRREIMEAIRERGTVHDAAPAIARLRMEMAAGAR